MSNQPAVDPNNPLTPSELILLNGDQFAKKVMMGNIQLMHTDASVSISQLAEAMLSAGVLAVESNRGIKFDIRSEKAMFGLRKVIRLYCLATYQSNDWPAYSLESRVMEIAEQKDRDGENSKLSDVIYSWLRTDSPSPWQSAIELVKSGLAERNLLESNETTRLKVFTKVAYSLPESTAELASQISTEPVKKMLSETENDRNDVWELLKKELKQAVKQRTEQDDMDFD